jgi:N-acetylglucosaminylphosphatidylinositol deacetylase
MSSATSNKKELFILVIAHPDDESMFFLPTIKSLIERKKTLWLLCLTTGDYDGLGRVREKELIQACQLLGIHKTLCRNDERLQDHPTQRWPIQSVSKAIQEGLTQLLAEEETGNYRESALRLITFDSLGVSGHVNHMDTHLGVWELIRSNENNNLPPLQAFQLQSQPNLFLKYLPIWQWVCVILKLLLGWKHSQKEEDNNVMTTISYHWHQPLLNWKAMATHKSQFVWYRRLFVAFSCYTYTNELIPIQSGSTIKMKQ